MNTLKMAAILNINLFVSRVFSNLARTKLEILISILQCCLWYQDHFEVCQEETTDTSKGSGDILINYLIRWGLADVETYRYTQLRRSENLLQLLFVQSYYIPITTSWSTDEIYFFLKGQRNYLLCITLWRSTCFTLCNVTG